LTEPEVVIVGAGLAGLTAAVALADRGLSVTVIEASDEIGGRLDGIESEGYRLDAGMHCFGFGDPGVAVSLRERLGLTIECLSAGDAGYLLRGKERLPVPADSESDSDPAGVPGFDLKENKRLYKFIDRVMGAEPKPLYRKSVAEFIAEAGFEADELVADYAGALCLTLLGRGIAETSAGLLVAHCKKAGRAGWRVSAVAGGPGGLGRALVERADKDLVRLSLGSVVQEIQVHGERVKKVVASSGEYRPEALVYTGPIQKLPDIVTGDGLSPTYARQIAKFKPVAGISLELGLASPVSDIKGVMIDPAEAVIGRFPSNLDHALAPEGAQVSSWLMLIDHEDLESNKTTRSHIKRLKRIIKRQFPKIFDQARIERLRVIPQVASVAPLPKQVAAKKHLIAKGTQNLFIAGDAAINGGILSTAAVTSAFKAVEGIKKFLEEIQTY